MSWGLVWVGLSRRSDEYLVLMFQERPAFIPEGALTRRKAMEVDAPKRKLVGLVVMWSWGRRGDDAAGLTGGFSPLFW